MGNYWTVAMSDYRSYYKKETERVLKNWEGVIQIESVQDRLDWKVVTAPLPCGDNFIYPRYLYNGASSGLLQSVPIFGFPKWRHPIATARHDFRIDLAEKLYQLKIIKKKEYDKLRKIADKLFKEDVSLGQTSKCRSWWEQTKGYTGVRIGANWRKVTRRFGR